MPSQSTIRLVRRALLLVLLGFGGVIGFLLWFGQQRPEDPLLARDRATTPGELDVDVSTGFDYTISVGGRELMRVRADRVVSRAGKEVSLQQIGPIELYRSDGQTIFVRADRGSVDIESGGASLVGNVELQGVDDTALLTDQMNLAAEGKIVRSQGEVQLRKGDEISGRADRLTADLEQNTFQLVGRVQFTVRDAGGGPDYRLSGRRATYYADRSEAEFAGGVTLNHGEGELTSRQMSAVGGESGGLQQVRFRRGVKGHWIESQPGAQPVRVDLLAQDLDLNFDAAGELIESRLRRHRPVKVTLTQGRTRQSLSGLHIDIRWNGGQPVSGEVRDRAQVVESTPDGGRSGASNTMDFELAGGELTRLAMQDNVRVQEDDATTTGDHATYMASTHKFTVTGNPAQTTVPSGHLTSPEIVYDASARTAAAVPPVRGQFERGNEPGVISGEQPSKFEARSATWDQAQSQVTLSGEARIWQGRDLLVAGEIRSDLERRSVEADGDVRVILEQRSEQPDGSPVRIEAASDRMTYDEAERVIHMVGNSTAQREGRTLSCAELDVILSADGEAQRMLCSGGAQLLDPVAGRTVTGTTTVYEIEAREARFTGDPVLVKGDDGSQVSGFRLRYQLDTGEAIMDLGDKAPAGEAATDGGPVVLEPDAEVRPEEQKAAPPEETPASPGGESVDAPILKAVGGEEGTIDDE